MPGNKKYATKFNNNGDIMIITLDLIKFTLSYTINGTDYGIAPFGKSIDKCSYRLVIALTISGKGMEIEIS